MVAQFLERLVLGTAPLTYGLEAEAVRYHVIDLTRDAERQGGYRIPLPKGTSGIPNQRDLRYLGVVKSIRYVTSCLAEAE